MAIIWSWARRSLVCKHLHFPAAEYTSSHFMLYYSKFYKSHPSFLNKPLCLSHPSINPLAPHTPQYTPFSLIHRHCSGVWRLQVIDGHFCGRVGFVVPQNRPYISPVDPPPTLLSQVCYFPLKVQLLRQDNLMFDVVVWNDFNAFWQTFWC